MKKLKQSGKEISKEQAKKIQGGKPRLLYWCNISSGCYCQANTCPFMCAGECNVIVEGANTCFTLCSN